MYLHYDSNPSFEFNAAAYATSYVHFDTDFTHSRICWVAANETGNPIILNDGVDTFSVSGSSVYIPYKAHTGVSAAHMFSFIGNAYSLTTHQFVDTSASIVADVRTYQQTMLLKPLVAGTTYYFSLYIGEEKTTNEFVLSTGDVRGNIGVYFSSNKISDYSEAGRIHVTPQIRFTEWDVPDYDTLEYTRLSGTYTAIGGEQYMTIGNFDFYAQQYYVYVSPYAVSIGQASLENIYPLIDDISLVSDTTLPIISLSTFSLGNDTVLCPGHTLILGGEPYFFHYWWNTGDTTRFITIDMPGTYWCKVDYGCNTYTDTINILPPFGTPSFNLPDISLCSGSIYIVYAPAGYPQYTWSTGITDTDAVTLDSAGTYWVNVGDACGNHYADTFSVTGINATIIPFTIPDKYLCMGADTINAPPGYVRYLWSNGDTALSIVVDSPGTYNITVTNTCNTQYTDTFHVYDAISGINLGSDTIICNGDFSDILTIPSAFTNIAWSAGENTNSITVTNSGSYWVQAQSPCGIFSDTILVSFCAPLIDSISISADTICSGQCLTFSTAVQNYPQTETWTFTGGSPSSCMGADPPSICYAAAGTDMVKLVVTSPGGTDSMIKEVVVLPAPRGSFADTVITVPYKSFIELQPCVPAQHTIWYHNDTLVCDTCTLLTADAVDYHSTYTCVVSNAGCTDTCTYIVWVSGIPTDVWLPTAFTPNGDGKNDYFHIITDNPNIQVLTFSVYNRYGQEIYNVANNSQGWDGTFNGNHIDTDVYFWYLRYKVYGNDTIFFKKGDVTLIR